VLEILVRSRWNAKAAKQFSSVLVTQFGEPRGVPPLSLHCIRKILPGSGQAAQPHQTGTRPGFGHRAQKGLRIAVARLESSLSV
jgi:transposase-like protein